jgi:hypothetical protein
MINKEEKKFIKYMGPFGSVYVIDGADIRAFEAGCTQRAGRMSLAEIEKATGRVFNSVPSFIDNRKDVS